MKKCFYDYQNSCTCAEDDKCGCDYDNNMEHDVACEFEVPKNIKNSKQPVDSASENRSVRKN